MHDAPRVGPEKLAERERSAVPFHVLINPVIVIGSEAAEFFEGCLSAPGFTALVPGGKPGSCSTKIDPLQGASRPPDLPADHSRDWSAHGR
jgi:peptide deformylase